MLKSSFCLLTVQLLAMFIVQLLLTLLNPPKMFTEQYLTVSDISELLNKKTILILNKIDMVHPSVSVSWKKYFEEKLPGIYVVLFSSQPEEQRLEENNSKGLLRRRVQKNLSWAYGSDAIVQMAKAYYEDHTEPKSNEQQAYVTIGLIGQPNAGKSSLINGILQSKKVSVSRTPGHTKHFQTIFYSSDIRLCDCPGLVFPTIAPKQLQILAGMFPVSQVH